MFVKPNPNRTVALHQGGEMQGGCVVGGEMVNAPIEVLHPQTRQSIDADGVEVPEDIYWMRRLRDGDVVLVNPAAAVAAPAVAAPAASTTVAAATTASTQTETAQTEGQQA